MNRLKREALTFRRILMRTLNKLVTSLILVSLGACAQPMSGAAKGGLAGGTLGAGAGAIIGSQTGHAGPGIAIGAGLGALTGALIGNTVDGNDGERQRLEDQQLRQQQELERQRREIEEMRRQQGGDYKGGNRDYY